MPIRLSERDYPVVYVDADGIRHEARVSDVRRAMLYDDDRTVPVRSTYPDGTRLLPGGYLAARYFVITEETGR